MGTIVWKNATDNNPTQIAVEHEYVICFARSKAKLPSEWKSTTIDAKERLIEVGEEFLREYPDPQVRQKEYTEWFRKNRPYLWPFQDYKFIDEGGIYTGMRSVHNPGKEGYRYDVLHPITGRPCRQPMMGYRFPEETMRELLLQDRILFGEDDAKIVELKVYVQDFRSKLSSLFELDGRRGTNEIKAIFPESKRPFDFPKPIGLIEELLSFSSSGNDVVLDSFAGSGTTGHAVIQINQADGGNRQFILIEMDRKICTELTAERLKRVTLGYSGANSDIIEGLGDGFRFCRLGPALFNGSGQISSEVVFTDLARHVYFTETGEPQPATSNCSALLGVHHGVAIYLLFNGVMGDQRPEGGNILTAEILASLPEHEGPKVIYGEGCLLSRASLQVLGVTFRQVPYEVKVR